MSSGANEVLDLTLEPASIDQHDAVCDLLSDNHLPTVDLEAHIGAFTLATCKGVVVGTAGLESYGELALLRSLCVAKSYRSRRIGEALVSAVSSRALAGGVRELYLLTTDAESYFASLGFAPVERQHVPSSIRGTAQFSSLCPSSAVCMRKTIEPSLELAAGFSTARLAAWQRPRD
jgi:amino-acid N-acetyltransferase